MNAHYLLPLSLLLLAYLTNPDYESFLQQKTQSANTEFGPVAIPFTSALFNYAFSRKYSITF